MKIISEGDRPFSWAIPFELLADKWRISNQLEQKSIKPRERLRSFFRRIACMVSTIIAAYMAEPYFWTCRSL